MIEYMLVPDVPKRPYKVSTKYFQFVSGFRRPLLFSIDAQVKLSSINHCLDDMENPWGIIQRNGTDEKTHRVR